MKSLYDKNFRYNPVAQALDAQVGQLLKPIFDKLVEEGFNPREISHVVQATANELELESIISKKPSVEGCKCTWGGSHDCPLHKEEIPF